MAKMIRIMLDEIMAAKDVSRYELRNAIKTDAQTLNKYYYNKIERMDKALLIKMCVALKIDIGDLLKIVDIEEI